eukprot:6405784-Prymnesium_polylepis.2
MSGRAPAARSVTRRRPARERAVAAGDELTLCYVDPRLPAATRRAKLSAGYFFSCDCRACAADVAQWSCLLCGAFNDAFSTRCAAARCTGEQRRHAMPIGKRGGKRGRGGPAEACD